MTKQIKEFLLEEETDFANVEYDDGSTLRFNLANLASGSIKDNKVCRLFE